MRATALSYAWGVSSEGVVPVEAGVNDVQLDSLVTQLHSHQGMYVQGNEKGPLQYHQQLKTDAACPNIRLSCEDVQQQIVLLQDGLLGRGEREREGVWMGFEVGLFDTGAYVQNCTITASKPETFS